jgi:hypothetical protein
MDGFTIRQLYGGAVEVLLPARLQSLADMIPVPDNQEVFSDPDNRRSYFVELLQMEEIGNDEKAVQVIYQDLIDNNQASDNKFIEVNRTCHGSFLVKAQMMVDQRWVNLFACVKRIREFMTDVLFYISQPDNDNFEEISRILNEFDRSFVVKDSGLFV